VPLGTTELTISGTDLLADDTTVMIDGRTAGAPGSGSTGTSLRVPVSGLRPGVHTIQVVRGVALGTPNATPHVGFTSNTVLLVVPPEIEDTSLRYVGDPTDPRIELKAPAAEGDATLLLYSAGAGGASYTLRSRTRAGTDDPFTFDAKGVGKAKYLVRLQVGGATSGLVPDGVGPYTGPTVEVT